MKDMGRAGRPLGEGLLGGPGKGEAPPGGQTLEKTRALPVAFGGRDPGKDRGGAGRG